MKMKQAVDIILTSRRSARRVGMEFFVNRDRLGSVGGFSTDQIDRIEKAVDDIENALSSVMATLD